MGITRRALIRTGAAGAVVVGSTGSWLMTRTSQTAREPWRAAEEGFGDARLNALAYAILAPNPHNMQPWRIRLVGDDALTVYADTTRLLPQTDPPCRQITIGFGAFLELLRQAAAQQGQAIEVDSFPEGEPFPILDRRPIAHVRFRAAAVTPDELFPQTLQRRTQRQNFDTDQPVSEAILKRMIASASPGVSVAASAESSSLQSLRTLTGQAWINEWETAATRRETIAVTRIGKQEVAANPWGITLDGPLMSTLGGLSLLSREAMDQPGTASYDQSLSTYLAACDTAMAHIWSSTAQNSRQDQLNAGVTWVRLHQAATREGLAFHPLSQALQEFPEMQKHYRRVHELLAPPGHTLQMLCRLGYANFADPAPREPLHSQLLPV